MQLDWEIWLDNNISPAIAKWLSDETGWIVKSSYVLQLHYMDDITFYNKAKEYSKVIILSKDTDLPELVNRLGAPPKIIFITIGNCDNRMLWNFIKERIFAAIEILTKQDIPIVELE